MPPPTRPWKIRLFCATSLNGYLARVDHSITWLTSPAPNPAHKPATPLADKTTPSFEAHMSTVDFIVMGRQTFDVCVSLPEWPYPTEKEVLVLSRRLDSPPQEKVKGKVRVVRSIEEVERILDAEVKEGRMVYVDGGQTTREFLRRGWVDEVVLTVAPVVLAGGGRGLFGGLELQDDLEFTLDGVDVIENGMVTVYYQVKDKGQGK